jgi:hypothetical protein
MLKLLTAYGVSHRERQDIAALTQGVRAGWWGDPTAWWTTPCWNRPPTT